MKNRIEDRKKTEPTPAAGSKPEDRARSGAPMYRLLFIDGRLVADAASGERKP